MSGVLLHWQTFEQRWRYTVFRDRDDDKMGMIDRANILSDGQLAQRVVEIVARECRRKIDIADVDIVESGYVATWGTVPSNVFDRFPGLAATKLAERQKLEADDILEEIA